MQQKISLKLLPSEADNDSIVKQMAAQACAVSTDKITGLTLLKRSIDARGRQQWINLTVNVFIDEPFIPTPLQPLQLQPVHQSPKKVIVVGAGPAGLFAAIRLIELGIQPIVLERGKDVRS